MATDRTDIPPPTSGAATTEGEGKAAVAGKRNGALAGECGAGGAGMPRAGSGNLDGAHDNTSDGRVGATVTPFPGLRKRPPRERLLEAVLLESGERGYEHVSVQLLIDRAQTSRATFYKHFDGKEECFVRAHRDAAEWLYAKLVSAARRGQDWRAGLRAAMAELLELCANQPAIAKSLIVEAHAAGERALAQRNELMERLAHALDSARREPGSLAAPPPLASSFIVGALETHLASKLIAGEAEDIPDMLPGLLHFVVMQYFGESAAWDEMAAASLATWRARRESARAIPLENRGG